MAGKQESIRKACKITDEIFEDLVMNINMFKKEIDIDRFIRSSVRKQKLKLAFPPIVATGKNAADPHHKPKNSRLNGFTVVDFGVKVGGYCSDMSRTLFFGKPSKSQVKVYSILLRSQKCAIRSIRLNRRYSDIDKKCRTNLGKYKRYFIHALGHGLGKKVHCDPIIASVLEKREKLTKKRKNIREKIKKAIVKQDDIITIEPGIYIKNKWGMRVEDTILVKKNKEEILTKSPKRLIIS